MNPILQFLFKPDTLSSQNNRLSSYMRFCVYFLGIGMTIALPQAHASSNPLRTTSYTSQLQPTPPNPTPSQYYTLALTQVLSEICPSMLTFKQQQQLKEAYQNQLRVFTPSSQNPKEFMGQLATKKEYQEILQNLRTWTASFPAKENKAMCQEFVSTSASF